MLKNNSYISNVAWSVSQVEDNLNLEELVLLTTELQLSSSLDSLFPILKWDVRFPPTILHLVDTGIFEVGKTFEFVFEGTTKKRFRLLKIISNPTSQTVYTPDAYTFILTSPWYFEQNISSKIYAGTIQESLRNVMESLPSIKKISCIEGGSQSRRCRYRTFQTESSFIRERLKPFFTGEDPRSASFIYVNEDCEFFATDETTILSQKDQTVYAISVDHPNASTALSKAGMPTQSEEALSKIFFMGKSGLFSNTNEALWPNSKPSTLYLSDIPGAIKKPQQPPAYTALSSNTFLPITNSKAVAVITRLFSDDSSRAVPDVKAVAQNEIVGSLFNSQGLVLAGGIAFNIKVGVPICVVFEESSANSRLANYSQTYVVSTVIHSIKGNNSCTTSITCNKSSLSYADETRVTQFYRG